MSECGDITINETAVALTIQAAAGSLSVESPPAVNLQVAAAASTIEIIEQPAAIVEVSAGPRGFTGESGNPPVSAEADQFVKVGQVVYVKSDTHVGLARANALPGARAAGFVTVGATATFPAEYVTDGQHEQEDWTDVIGTAHLTPGTTYFLSNTTAGQMTATPPSTGFIQPLGRAVSSTKFAINIGTIIKRI